MTDAELTILSLLAEGARHGHEIQQIIEERGLREWLSIGFSSVFYILNKLEKQQMVSSELYPNGHRPARKRYELTEAGRGILQTSISNLLREPRALGTGFELGLANLHVLKPAQVYRVLTHHRSDLMRQLKAVEQSWERHQAEDDTDNMHNVRALYTHSITRMQAEIAWLDSFLDDWRTRYPAVADRPITQPHRPDDMNSAPTDLAKQPLPDTLKMIQRLKRVKPPQDEDGGGDNA